MIIRYGGGVALIVLLLICSVVESRLFLNDFLRFSFDLLNDNDDSVGTRWTILIACSNGYWNYRHMADVCHAYQVLKKGGLKDENIIVCCFSTLRQAEHAAAEVALNTLAYRGPSKTLAAKVLKEADDVYYENKAAPNYSVSGFETLESRLSGVCTSDVLSIWINVDNWSNGRCNCKWQNSRSF